jgi:hypothetical protein
MMQSVQVIIERLKSHPEEFFGDVNEHKSMTIKQPKFYDVISKLDNLLTENQDGQVHRLWYLEPEEKEALLAAYKQARRERFEAKVFHTLLTKQEQEEVSTVTFNTKDRYTTGIIAPQNMLKQATEILNKEFDKEYAKNIQHKLCP